MPTPFRSPFSTLICLGALLVLTAGCSSDDRGPARRGGNAGHRGNPPAPMAGQEAFFNGQLGVEIKVGGMEGPGDLPGEGSKVGDGGGERRRGGGGGGMGGGRRRGGGGSREAEGGGEGGASAEGPRPMLGSSEPPVMIHLRFTNHGSERVVVNIVDFVSPLGNFAVQPEKLALDPGQSTETEPMSSRLVGSLAEADATLALQIGSVNEKKIVKLRAVLPAAPGSPAQPPDPPRS